MDYPNCHTNSPGFYLIQISLPTLLQPECDSITGSRLRNDCYTSFARSSKDPTLCDRITDEGSRMTCCQSAGYAVVSEDTCNAAKSLKCADECVISQAQSRNDSRVCEKISDTKIKERCKVLINR